VLIFYKKKTLLGLEVLHRRTDNALRCRMEMNVKHHEKNADRAKWLREIFKGLLVELIKKELFLLTKTMKSVYL
jgi:hypothetical protein